MADLVDIVEDTVATLVHKKEEFTAFDVTEKIRDAGLHVRHFEVRKFVHDLWNNGAMDKIGYTRYIDNSLAVPKGMMNPWRYLPRPSRMSSINTAVTTTTPQSKDDVKTIIDTQLASGKFVTITFRKVYNNKERVMNCKKLAGSSFASNQVATVYDLVKKDTRSFRYDTVTKVVSGGRTWEF